MIGASIRSPADGLQELLDRLAERVGLDVDPGVDQQRHLPLARRDAAAHGQRAVVAGHVADQVAARAGQVELQVGDLRRLAAQARPRIASSKSPANAFQSMSPRACNLAEAFIQPSAASPAA